MNSLFIPLGSDSYAKISLSHPSFDIEKYKSLDEKEIVAESDLLFWKSPKKQSSEYSFDSHQQFLKSFKDKVAETRIMPSSPIERLQEKKQSKTVQNSEQQNEVLANFFQNLLNRKKT